MSFPSDTGNLAVAMQIHGSNPALIDRSIEEFEFPNQYEIHRWKKQMVYNIYVWTDNDKASQVIMGVG